MKAYLLLPAVLLGGLGAAQTTNAPAPPKPHIVEVEQPPQPGDTAAVSVSPDRQLDPAKVAELKQRFDQGYALQQAGNLDGARKVYDGILAEQPNARRSLLEAGRTSFQLGDAARADGYLERLHTLEPQFPEAIELLIQINEVLKRDVKVELLIKAFRELHDSGGNPQFTASRYFVRERFDDSGHHIIITEFFDYHQEPNTVWMAEVFDAAGTLQRRILLNYDAEATRALRAKDAKYANTQIFTWFEHVMKDGHVTAINAYLQIFALPDYYKFRSAMLVILANPPKPIYSAPVDAAQ
jgi:tetratricopeptide (TPR) repeat protein